MINKMEKNKAWSKKYTNYSFYRIPWLNKVKKEKEKKSRDSLSKYTQIRRMGITLKHTVWQ